MLVVDLDLDAYRKASRRRDPIRNVCPTLLLISDNPKVDPARSHVSRLTAPRGRLVLAYGSRLCNGVLGGESHVDTQRKSVELWRGGGSRPFVFVYAKSNVPMADETGGRWKAGVHGDGGLGFGPVHSMLRHPLGFTLAPTNATSELDAANCAYLSRDYDI